MGLGVDKRGMCWGELSLEEFVIGEENFHEGSARFSRTI